jgi:hypothetical protein
MNTKTWLRIMIVALAFGLGSIGCSSDDDKGTADAGGSNNAGTTGGSGSGAGSGGTGASGTGGSAGSTAGAGSVAEDPSCPPFDGTVGGMTIHLPGCCTPENKCGVISSISMMCITTSMYIDLPANPKACGGGDADGGEADGG